MGRGVLDGSSACHLRRDSGQVPEVCLIAWPQFFCTCGLCGIPAGAYTNNPRFIGNTCRNLDPFGFKMGTDSLGPCSLGGEGMKQEGGSLFFPSWGPQKRTQPPCSAVRASCEHLLPEPPSDGIVSYFQRWQRPSRPTSRTPHSVFCKHHTFPSCPHGATGRTCPHVFGSPSGNLGLCEYALDFEGFTTVQWAQKRG